MPSVSWFPQVYTVTISSATISPISDEDTTNDNPESQEMLEEQLVRLLTREVMDLISE